MLLKAGQIYLKVQASAKWSACFIIMSNALDQSLYQELGYFIYNALKAGKIYLKAQASAKWSACFSKCVLV